jgi:hypothetical protein
MSLSAMLRGREHQASHSRKQFVISLISLVSIACVAATGGALSYAIGQGKAFIVIVAGLAIWSFVGWHLGHWRLLAAGYAALSAASAASAGAYSIAALCVALAFLLLFAQVSPREL